MKPMVPPAEPRSYYGRPVIKEPVWTPEIPVYFFAGGMAGASAGLAFGARLLGRRRLARAATANAFLGVAVSPARRPPLSPSPGPSRSRALQRPAPSRISPVNADLRCVPPSTSESSTSLPPADWLANP